MTLSLSLIIPSFNRPDGLARTLACLPAQTLPVDRFEVIVVDDGSPQPLAPIVAQSGLPNARCIRQPNRGATWARNTGAEAAAGQLLVFMDDDICLQPGALDALARAVAVWPHAIVVGDLQSPAEMPKSVFARVVGSHDAPRLQDRAAVWVHFAHCQTGLLAVRREIFMAIGMFRDPTGGWPNWDDVDFGYRAYLHGVRIRREFGAVGDHWDYSLDDWQTAARRWERASWSAAKLFVHYPELQSEIPMFRDMTPIEWSDDAISLVARKLVRRLVAFRPITWFLEQMVYLFEAVYPSPTILGRLYRWVNGSYIYRGYRSGVRDLETTRA